MPETISEAPCNDRYRQRGSVSVLADIPESGHIDRNEVIAMRKENVEILSDRTNAAIMRHPDRKFPGVLVQGDTLSTFCASADAACREMGRSSPGFDEANDLRNALYSLLNHYKSVLGEHSVPLPFSDQPL